MRRTSKLAHATAAAAMVLALGGAPALAEEDGAPADPMEQAEEGLRRLMFALELLIASIPQYEMPEVLDNGDIIIRRVQPVEPVDPDDTNGDDIEETEI